MKPEIAAVVVVGLLLLGFPAALFGYQAWAANPPGIHVISIAANSPANGGWQPDSIRVNAGDRVRLRISGNDVVHGFAVPALGLRVDEILPGHVAEVDFTADKPGRYPFSCTRWCSLDHWRMRGVIEVVDPTHPDAPLSAKATPPLYQQYKIDIDAMHAAEDVPASRPSAQAGAAVAPSIPARLADKDYLRLHSPSQVWADLRAAPGLAKFSDSELWDAVAWMWKGLAGDDAVARGRQAFSQDCAACHGETGRGDGPAGRNLPGLSAMHPDIKRGPADFTDARQMLGASDILLQGKILRGGMGSGMPEWGSLYQTDQMWDLIAYLRTFTLGR